MQEMSSTVIVLMSVILSALSHPQGPYEGPVGANEGQDQGRVANIMSSLGDAVKSATRKGQTGLQTKALSEMMTSWVISMKAKGLITGWQFNRIKFMAQKIAYIWAGSCLCATSTSSRP